MKITWTIQACLLLTILVIMACGDGEQTQMTAEALKWGYDGPGAPENWASLSEEYALCAEGKQQSPVNIDGYREVDAKPILFSYSSDARTVRNDGYFVHVEFAAGNTLSLGQRIYNLKSTHFHSPSEHQIDGVSFAAEMHLVHADADDRLIVVGLLFRLGEPSPIVQVVLDAAPAPGNGVRDGIAVNASGLVPDQLGYYQYDGSKTTPPCYEPVGWYVMRESKNISQEQVDRLLRLSGGHNNRPVQPVGSRIIAIGGAP
jgi:carbonic anhydrase